MDEQMTSENEQWKLNGDCNKCRKALYCTKDCGARKQKVKRWKKALGNAIIDTVMPEPFASHAKEWY